MLHLLKRHPFAVQAFFRHSLVLTYAIPGAVLRPLLPPGLLLDTYESDGETYGFLAVALVQTEALRPRALPAWMGRDFFLSGYRIFARLDNAASLRGLRILRSDTDSRFMTLTGNLFTHYRYERARVEVTPSESHLRIRIQTPAGAADLDVTADLSGQPALLPPGSPFPDMRTARRFAGPLPYTFDYEPETHSIVAVRGVRESWDPQPVAVTVNRCAYLDREPFRSAPVRLANAFHMRDVHYRWDPGMRIPIGAPMSAQP